MTRKLQPLLLLLLLLLSCVAGCETVSTRYATLDHARQAGLFQRGWMPDILPRSARDIRMTNDVDRNTATGRFEFIDTDSGPFFRQLAPGAPDHSPLRQWDTTRRDYAEAGYREWTYEARGTWVFFCHPGKDECEYAMWL